MAIDAEGREDETTAGNLGCSYIPQISPDKPE
jgi:hypothetical protein